MDASETGDGKAVRRDVRRCAGRGARWVSGGCRGVASGGCRAWRRAESDRDSAEGIADRQRDANNGITQDIHDWAGDGA